MIKIRFQVKNMEAKREQIANTKTFSDYLYLWVGQNISYFGSAIVVFIIILQLSGNENYILSVAALLSFGPSILFGTVAGVVADRFNKKVIILITDSLQTLATLALIVLYYVVIDVQIWQIYIISIIRGICQAFHGPVVMSLTPLMVPQEKLSRMNGIGYLFNSLIGVLGPILGAQILFVLNISVRDSLWIDIITYVIAVIPLFIIKIPQIKSTHEEGATNGEHLKSKSFFGDMKEGFATIRTISGLLSLMLMASIINLLLQPLDVLFPNFIMVELEQTPVIYAYASAGFPIGILVGSLITFIKKKWKNESKWIFWGLLTVYLFYGLLFLPKILPEGFFFLIYIFSFFMGLSIPLVNVLVITIVQKSVPLDKMGRVSSLLMVLSSIASPIGMIGAGFVADALDMVPFIRISTGGIGFLYLICSVIGFLIGIGSWFFTDWRKISSNVEEEEEKIDKLK